MMTLHIAEVYYSRFSSWCMFIILVSVYQFGSNCMNWTPVIGITQRNCVGFISDVENHLFYNHSIRFALPSSMSQYVIIHRTKPCEFVFQSEMVGVTSMDGERHFQCIFVIKHHLKCALFAKNCWWQTWNTYRVISRYSFFPNCIT